jgi:hypothetical protein
MLVKTGIQNTKYLIFIGFNKNKFRYSREIALTLSSVEGCIIICIQFR